MKESVLESIIENHYVHQGDGKSRLGDRVRQVNVSMSIDSYALLRVASEEFGMSLSGLCSHILDDQLMTIIQKVAEFDPVAADNMLGDAAVEAQNEAKRQGLGQERKSYWSVILERNEELRKERDK